MCGGCDIAHDGVFLSQVWWQTMVFQRMRMLSEEMGSGKVGCADDEYKMVVVLMDCSFASEWVLSGGGCAG